MRDRDTHPVFFKDSHLGSLMASRPGVGEAGGAANSRAQTPPVAKFVQDVKFLAIDQSQTNLGWARASPGDERPACNTFKPPKIKAPDGTDLIEVVLLAIHHFLEQQFDKRGVTHVFIETVYFDEKRGNPEMYARLTTVRDFIRYRCAKRNPPIRCEEVSPATWRRHFLGHADSHSLPDGLNLKSEAMRICARIGWSVCDEHQAEAAGILAYALSANFPNFARFWDPLFLRGAQP